MIKKSTPTPSLETQSPRRLGLWLGLELVLGTFLAYHRVASHGYVRYDDNTYVTENPKVLAGLTADSVAWAFHSASYGANWHPLTWLSHMLDVQLFGADRPGAQHLENVLLHALVALLLFYGLLRLWRKPWTAFLAAALFAWHPLRVESVAWISERKDVLSALCLALTIWAYVRWCRKPGTARYLWILACLAMGLMAKPMLVSAPALLLVLDGWPLGRLRSRADLWPRLREKLPLVPLVLISAWLTFQAQSADGVVATGVPLDVRLTNALASLGSYVGQTLWPTNLCAIYPLASSISADPIAELWQPALLGGALMLALGLLAWRLRRSFPALGAGLLWYWIALIPVIGIVQVGDQAHADRYSYLPLIGLTSALALAIDRLAQRSALARRVVIAASGLALLLALLLSERQSATWQDSRSLFNQALRIEPRNPVALANNGYLWQLEGELHKAQECYEGALAIGAPRLEVQLNLASTYLQTGADGRARALLEKLRRKHPKEWRVFSLLGDLAFQTQNLELALERYGQALRLGSTNPEDQLQLGLLLMGESPSIAREHFRRALSMDPSSVKALYALGRLELSEGRRKPALVLLQKAIELSPEPPAALRAAWLEAGGS